MIPAEFDYAAPRSLDEAVRLLSGTEGAKVLGGGMSLIPALKHRLSAAPLLVDLARIGGLDQIALAGGRIRIGGRATHAAVMKHPELAKVHIFAETGEVLADPQVRNRGTLGGSLVHADPAADWPAVFLALGGEATLVSAKGSRSVGADDFFQSLMTSAVQEGEILSEVSFPVLAPKTGTAYSKLRQPASGFAIVGVAVCVRAERTGVIDDARIGVTGVNSVPFRARSLEDKLRGKAVSGPALRAFCAEITEADPMSDLHASADYRRHLLGVFAARTIERAIQRAQA
jgi:aerobic carbon-monoxide dehydrogenase medium subunit